MEVRRPAPNAELRMRRHPRVAQIKLEDDRHADLRQRKDIAGACTRRDIPLKLAQKGGQVF